MHLICVCFLSMTFSCIICKFLSKVAKHIYQAINLKKKGTYLQGTFCKVESHFRKSCGAISTIQLSIETFFHKSQKVRLNSFQRRFSLSVTFMKTLNLTFYCCFALSKIIHFSRQKLVLRQLFSEWRFLVTFFCKWV